MVNEGNKEAFIPVASVPAYAAKVPVLPSFKDLKAIIPTPKEPLAEISKSENEEPIPFKPIDIEELGLKIKQYANLKKLEDKMLEYSFFNERAFSFSNNKITFKINNELQLSQLNGFKNGIEDHLKSIYGYYISTDTEIVKEAEQNKKLYTSSDKLNYLLEQYPALEELKKRLGLEIEY